jgi:hypothetical protein
MVTTAEFIGGAIMTRYSLAVVLSDLQWNSRRATW